MPLGVLFLTMMPLICHHISATSSPKEWNADGALALSLWLAGGHSCVPKSDQYRRYAQACLLLARAGLRCCTWHKCGFVWQKSA